MSQAFVIGRLDAFPPGSRSRVVIGGKAIAVFNEGGRLYALRDVCPHMGAHLSAGSVWSGVTASRPGDYTYCSEQKFVRCPWHGWEYELATGRSSYDPDKDRVRAYEIGVASGGDLAAESDESGRVSGPYVAETYRIVIDDEYVVIEL